jgi:hypothetical protein
MKKTLQFLKSNLSLLFAFGLLISFNADAKEAEDSCNAIMLVTPDHNDPLIVHFDFIGQVPIGSFQFLGSWDFGDGYTSTDSCPVHTYAQPGTYIVCLGFSICIGGGLSCHDDTCVSITIGTLAGMGDPDGNMHNFYFYPNPVKTSVHIRSDANRKIELNIKDATGDVVFNGMTGNDEAIDVSSLAAGMYLMQACDGKSIIQRKMVLQK